MEVLGTIILLDLLAVGGILGGQIQSKAGDQTGAGLNPATGPEWPSAISRNPDTLPYPKLWSGATGSSGRGAGIRSQPLELKQTANRRSPLLIGLYVAQGVLQGLDAQSTIRALHTGKGREGNPLVSPFATQPAALVVFKLALAAGTIYGIDRLHKHHSRLAITTLGAFDAAYLILVQRNYRSF